MAEIRSYLLLRHLRADPSAHVLAYRAGAIRRSGRGLSFWFRPLAASLAEVPVDDREVSLLFHGRSRDYQDVTVQGVLTYRVADPTRAAERVDFTIDPRRGTWTHQPLEKLSLVLSQLGQQYAWDWIARTDVRRVLAEGQTEIRQRLETGLSEESALSEMGLEVVSIRISSVQPSPELEKALEAPVREQIQQSADEAAFARRALAVEKERAIQENELQNRIELSKREEQLIAQQGLNTRREAEEQAEAQRIEAEHEAQRLRLAADTEAARVRVAAEADAERELRRGEARAQSLRLVEGARAEAERARMEAYRDLPPAVLWSQAARELAGKLERIEHLNVSPDMLGTALTDLLEAGARKLEG